MALYEETTASDIYAPQPPVAPPPTEPVAPPPQQAPQAPPQQQQQAPAGPPPAGTDESRYGIGHAIIDMMAQKLGFGTPIANVERLKVAGDENARRAESHKLQQADEERKQTIEQASRALAGPMVAVAKPDSPYYDDATHLQRINDSPAVRKMLGGAFKIADAGETGKDGKKLFQVDLVDEATGQVKTSFKDTTAGIVDRFDASLDPKSKALIRNHISQTVQEQEIKIAQARKLVDEGYAVKRALNIPTTEYDKYMDIKKQFPEMSDWQAREAAGLKVEDRYRPLGTSPVPMEDGRVGISVMDRQEGDRIKVIPLPGTTWAQYKAGTKKETEQWKNLYWPDTDEDMAHEKKAKGIFGAVLDATQDPNEQRRLMKDVLPAFREWAELHTGESTDKDGKPRKLTTGDMQKKLSEMIRAAGGGDPSGGEPQDDKGSIDYYERLRQRNRQSWRNFQAPGAQPNTPTAQPESATQRGRRVATTTYPPNWMTGADE